MFLLITFQYGIFVLSLYKYKKYEHCVLAIIHITSIDLDCTKLLQISINLRDLPTLQVLQDDYYSTSEQKKRKNAYNAQRRLSKKHKNNTLYLRWQEVEPINIQN